MGGLGFGGGWGEFRLACSGELEKGADKRLLEKGEGQGEKFHRLIRKLVC